MKNKIIFFVIIGICVFMIQFTEEHVETQKVKKLAAKTDTDRRACSLNLPALQEHAITQVAGYTFSYPCTAATDDHKNHRNKKRGNFELKLQLSLYELNNEIWPKTKEHKNINEPAQIKLFDAGFGIERPEYNTQLEGYQILDNLKREGVAFYQNHRRMALRLVYQRDAMGFQPTLKCTLAKHEEPESFLNSSQYDSKTANCRAYWMLTEDVAVLMFNFHPKHSMDFKDIYQNVNTGLQAIIIEAPPISEDSDAS